MGTNPRERADDNLATIGELYAPFGRGEVAAILADLTAPRGAQHAGVRERPRRRRET
jgi:hypothetical protein